MKEEVNRWWKKAKRDLSSAKYNFKGKKYDVCAFLCQQSAEKAFKALLIEKTNKFPKIHDLTKLAKLNNVPENILELCAKMNPAYIYSRYPDSPKKYTKRECKQTIDYCNEALKWTKKNLNS